MSRLSQHHHTARWLLAILTLILLQTACSAPEDDVRARLETYKHAVLWKDTKTLYALHSDSQGQSVICDQRFQDLFAKAKASQTPEVCGEASIVVTSPQEQRQKLDEKLVLMSEIIHFQCQNTGSTCYDFSKDLFHRRAASSPLLEKSIEKLDIKEIHLRDSDNATAYIEVYFHDISKPERMTIDLARSANTWWIITYPW